MIRCEKLTKRYGKTLALRELNLYIGAGEVHGFVGPNGAGKTTAMRILATLTRPTSGDAYLNGISVACQPERARQLVGYMPDFFGVYDSLKAWEYLDLYAGCLRIGAKERRRRIDELLALTALRDKREAYVDGLSRGMKQRLCLARALLHDPALLILDEPASGMDPRSRAQMRDILTEISQMGKTVLISSHILPELSQMCTTLSIIERGSLVFSGTEKALKKRMHADSELTVRFADAPNKALTERLMERITALCGSAPLLEAPDLWRIRSAREQDAQLLAELMAEGAQVCDFHRARVTLEKVFMEVTKE